MDFFIMCSNILKDNGGLHIIIKEADFKSLNLKVIRPETKARNQLVCEAESALLSQNVKNMTKFFITCSNMIKCLNRSSIACIMWIRLERKT